MSRGRGFPASRRECYVAALRGWEHSVVPDKSYRHQSPRPGRSHRPALPAKQPSTPGRPQLRGSASQVGPIPDVGARPDQKAAPAVLAAPPPHPDVPARRGGTQARRPDFGHYWGGRSCSRSSELLRLQYDTGFIETLQDGSSVRKELLSSFHTFDEP